MESRATKLLSKIIKCREKKINQALELKEKYTRMETLKKSGGVRVIFAPHPKLKEVQQHILHRLLYRIKVDSRLHAFVPGFSNFTNAVSHAVGMPRYVVRMDFKDAFPSVKKEHLRQLLKDIFIRQSLVRADMMDDFLDIILSLTTHLGRTQQGLPTSPYLLNIGITYSGLLERIEKVIHDYALAIDYCGLPNFPNERFPWSDEFPAEWKKTKPAPITFYSDDLTVSSSKVIPGRAIRDLERTIEEHGIFHINRKKTLYFNVRQGSPLITGMRISAKDRNREELEERFLEKYDLPISMAEVITSQLTEPFGGHWPGPRVSLPKKYIRKVRGLLHRAASDEVCRVSVLGHMAYIKSVYGANMPSQLVAPYERLTDAMMIEG